MALLNPEVLAVVEETLPVQVLQILAAEAEELEQEIILAEVPEVLELSSLDIGRK
jgi:hypothetical protein